MAERQQIPAGTDHRFSLLRGLLIGLLVLLLFALSVYAGPVVDTLEKLWAQLRGPGHSAAGQSGLSGLVTTRSLVPVAVYSLLYTGLCLLLLKLGLGHAGRFRLALLLYAAVFGAGAGLVLLGQLTGDAPWAYQLARRLIDFIVSPLPVIILVPLLRWYQPAEASR